MYFINSSVNSKLVSRLKWSMLLIVPFFFLYEVVIITIFCGNVKVCPVCQFKAHQSDKGINLKQAVSKPSGSLKDQKALLIKAHI